MEDQAKFFDQQVYHPRPSQIWETQTNLTERAGEEIHKVEDSVQAYTEMKLMALFSWEEDIKASLGH
jgi:hypothetical protein